MVRHELWRSEYKKNRYLEYLTQHDLEERTKHIISNMTILDNTGMISLHNINETGLYWMQVWTHTLEEFALRFGSYPNGFLNGFIAKAEVVQPSFPEKPKAVSAIQNIGGFKEGALCKFGKYKHLQFMYENGKIRIAPASYYNDPSLNNAIRDDELSFEVQTRADNLIIEDITGSKTPTFGQVKFKLESSTNYYVHCFASKYTYREFDDFEADCCIVIDQPRIFIKKMMKTVKTVLPDFHGFAAPVKYLDPLNVSPKDIDIFFAKHFKYTYQNEYRTVWLPNDPSKKLEPFFINIGPMCSYARIIRI